MTLRTPRRRISPRTRRRYRAIREFFRRAIGSSSQPETSIKISSSIALNVSDLKRKIFGIEGQLDRVSKHCQDVECLQEISSRVTKNLRVYQQEKCDVVNEKSEASSERKLNNIETKLIYKTSECIYRKSDESDYETKHNNDRKDLVQKNEMNNTNEKISQIKIKDKKSKLQKNNKFDPKLHKHQTHSAYENFSTAYSTSSFHSLAHPRNAHSHVDNIRQQSDRRYYNPQYRSISPGQLKDKKHKEYARRIKHETIHENKPDRTRKHKHAKPQVDEDFIADIIRRQYKPIKLFGKKESNLSQFSAPVCRDQEYSFRDNIRESSELCSCCHLNPKHKRHKYNDLNDIRSICDARLYGSKRTSRSKHRKAHGDVYNDSELYDMVPVKEKASPKSRRKFVEENLMSYETYKEVPPSPRTLQPRLNLKAQHCGEFDDYMAQIQYPRQNWSPHKGKKTRNHKVQRIESDITSEVDLERRSRRRSQKSFRPAKVQVGYPEKIVDSTVSVSNLPSPVYLNEQSHAVANTSLDRTQETDKTDKTLGEIKDLLQNFLKEIKKEPTASQCDKSENGTKVNDNTIPNAGQSFNKLSLGQCSIPPYLPGPTFASPCCYPVVYPVNCVQNGYVMANPSFTCTNCANIPQEHRSDDACNEVKDKKDMFNTETEELIKEIYKFVAHNSKIKSDIDSNKTKCLTSRGVGQNYKKASKHDAKVGTPNFKYSSKSCEAIGSKLVSENYYSTSPSYSDTILEKISLELTESETDINTKSTEEDKKKYNKFSKVLNSLGLLKKKKKDIIEELDENESLIDVEVKPKQNPPSFKQDATNYMLYQQDYYDPPPRPQPYQHTPEYHPSYHPPYNPMSDYPPSPAYEYYTDQAQHPSRQHSKSPPYRSPRPSAPPYNKSFDYRNHPEQVSLCLKEIEVKSTATQSERKMTTFQRFKQRIKPPARMPKYEDPQKHCSTQTPKEPAPKDNTPKWLKNLQEKAMEEKKMGMDPKKYSMKTQFELEQGNNKMRNVMMKKFFYKRNPFSPRNLLVKTLLGTDKTSYGAPPPLFKPKLWF